MKISNIKTEQFKSFRNLELVAGSGKNEFGATTIANWTLKDFCSNLGKFGKADFKIATRRE